MQRLPEENKQCANEVKVNFLIREGAVSRDGFDF
jgi:hypothetical protein